jgi:hypothetical protein
MLLKKVSTETPKVISPTDPRSAWTAKANKRVQFGYSLNYMIDTENAVIVDVEAIPARTYDEVTASKTMLDRTKEHLGLKPERLAADTAYGTGKFSRLGRRQGYHAAYSGLGHQQARGRVLLRCRLYDR